MATKKYKCKVCGYVHEGANPPEKCPVCGVPASEFELISEEKPAKKGFDKNSNTYIMIYTTIIVVLVALLLSITSGALKERQAANIKLDTKKQILSSLPAIDVANVDAEQCFASTIEKIIVLNEKTGEVVKELDPVKDFDYKANSDSDELLIYKAKADGATKWIIRLDGKGLWGAIWGYIALNDDKNTVYGVFFNHAGETPGLGANITTDAFCSQFEGKHIMQNGEFASIAVMKVGQKAESQDQVDAISGGTITSKGVELMLQTSVEKYTQFLKAIDCQEESVTEETNVEEE